MSEIAADLQPDDIRGNLLENHSQTPDPSDRAVETIVMWQVTHRVVQLEVPERARWDPVYEEDIIPSIIHIVFDNFLCGYTKEWLMSQIYGYSIGDRDIQACSAIVSILLLLTRT